MKKTVYVDKNDCNLEFDFKNKLLQLNYDDNSSIYITYNLSIDDIKEMILDLNEMLEDESYIISESIESVIKKSKINIYGSN